MQQNQNELNKVKLHPLSSVKKVIVVVGGKGGVGKSTLQSSVLRLDFCFV